MRKHRFDKAHQHRYTTVFPRQPGNILSVRGITPLGKPTNTRRCARNHATTTTDEPHQGCKQHKPGANCNKGKLNSLAKARGQAHTKGQESGMPEPEPARGQVYQGTLDTLAKQEASLTPRDARDPEKLGDRRLTPRSHGSKLLKNDRGRENQY